MLFSVITVTYNAEATLPPTVASIEAQTFKDFEFLLIDGASTDETISIAKKANIDCKQIYSNPDKGLYDAMNRGLGMARGRYVIFLNAGDSFPSSDTLRIYADAIASAPTKPGIVYGQTELVDADRRVLGPRHLRAPEHLDFRSFADGMTVCHQAMAVRRDIAGQYNLRYRFSADYEWCVRALLNSPLNVYVNAVTAHYLKDGLTTANHRASLKERYEIMSHYYGKVPTMLRHIKFALRALLGTKKSLKILQNSNKNTNFAPL